MSIVKVEIIGIIVVVSSILLYQFLKNEDTFSLDKPTRERFCHYYAVPGKTCQQDCYSYTDWFKEEGFGEDCSVCDTIKECSDSSSDPTRIKFCNYYSKPEYVCQRDCHEYSTWFQAEGYGDNCAVCSILKNCSRQ